jgi:hypothetical protein
MKYSSWMRPFTPNSSLCIAMCPKMTNGGKKIVESLEKSTSRK